MNPMRARASLGQGGRRRGRKRPARRSSTTGRSRAERGSRSRFRLSLPRSLRLALILCALVLTAVAAAALFADRLGEVDWSAPTNRLGEGLTLRAVEVLGTRHVEPERLVVAAGLEAGMRLYDIDLDAVLEAVSRHPRVARSRGARLPPDRLILLVSEREPIAALAGRDEGIDRDGSRFPLSAGEAQDLPSLLGDPEPALPVLLAALERGEQLREIRVAGSGDVRVRIEGEEIWLRVGREPARALEAWQQLVDRGVRRLQPGQVDLRFRGSAVLTDTVR
jgi:cell division septal protein FtsQ